MIAMLVTAASTSSFMVTIALGHKNRETAAYCDQQECHKDQSHLFFHRFFSLRANCHSTDTSHACPMVMLSVDIFSTRTDIELLLLLYHYNVYELL